jgi:hypothetical protein
MAQGRLFAALRVTALILAEASCTPSHRGKTPPANVAAVLERHSDSLLEIPGVVGTAEGSCGGHPCILVLVERLTPSLRHTIPPMLDGVPLEIRETGRIQAQ